MSGCARPDDVPEEALLVGDSGWTSLAVDEAHVYLSITNPPSQGSKSSILAIPKAGGDPETIVTNTETRAFGGLQQAGGYLYWQVGTLGVGSDQYAAIRRIELPAGE